MSEPISGITTPIKMEYRYTPGTATSLFLRAMKEAFQHSGIRSLEFT